MPDLTEVLTEDQIKAVVRVVHNTWEAVAPDYAEIAEYSDSSGAASADEVVEATLDADRYLMYGGRQEDIEVVRYVLDELEGFPDIPALLPHNLYELR